VRKASDLGSQLGEAAPTIWLHGMRQTVVEGLKRILVSLKYQLPFEIGIESWDIVEQLFLVSILVWVMKVGRLLPVVFLSVKIVCAGNG
jgi:hypothetical protein